MDSKKKEKSAKTQTSFSENKTIDLQEKEISEEKL